MTDREMLEFAFRAYAPGENYIRMVNVAGADYWNPLTNDADALRLAVRLEMCVDFMDRRVIAGELPEVVIDFEDNDYRRAIVKAAAKIGWSMV